MPYSRKPVGTELTNLEASLCQALASLSLNINVILQKLVEKGVFSQEEKGDFDLGMAMCVADMVHAEGSPAWAHGYPQDDKDFCVMIGTADPALDFIGRRHPPN